MHAPFCCTTMAMTALRWSSFVECMERVSRWPCTNSAYVCIALCVWSHLKVLLIGVWHSMRSSFCPHASFRCPNALQWRWWLCVDLRLFDVWNGYWVGPKPTARTFLLLLRLCSNLTVLLTFDTVWGRNLTLIMCCPNTLQWRWWFCVDLRSSNGWRIGPERADRTFVLLPVCALKLERVSGLQCSMRL